MKEYQEDGKIIIKFVKSEDNEADIFTKKYHQHNFPEAPKEVSLG